MRLSGQTLLQRMKGKVGGSQVAETYNPAHILHLGHGRPVRAKVHEDLGVHILCG